jgi:hypothetical protein
MRPPQTPVDGRAGPSARKSDGCRAARGNHSVTHRFLSNRRGPGTRRNSPMHGIIYLIGLIVVIMAILSFLGLR